ncbi:alcohol dehydrogenase catalytic domain-containing protein [Mycobacterium tuberculosis]|uniref:alcohol dehydrogenase catalytic domain-containing protein n=1 Tax=Mycobacterium tuberculosis TaxID=1773 RepID=UPI0039C00CA3
MSTAGTFENLRLELIPDADAPLGPGQVRVAVSAIAANFRDVMIALGLYPDPDAVMGVEACGVVIETSLNKGSFAVGDRVMGLFPEGTGTVASTDQRLLVKVPAGWSHTAAATTSVVFATAHYALVDLAAARSGQRVLIHAGTAGWAWRRCSWLGIWGWRCSRPRARVSGTPCAPWALTTTTYPIHVA